MIRTVRKFGCGKIGEKLADPETGIDEDEMSFDD